MGKGTRNRQVRAEDKVTSLSKYVQKQNKSVVYGTWALGIFAIVLVVSLLFTGLVGAGVFMRTRTAAETEDFEVDGAMMSYFVHSYYSSYVQQFEERYSSLISSSNLSIYTLIGIDPNVSLKKQVKDKTTGETWFQYFAAQAKTQVKEILVYSQAAKIAGVELGEEELSSIDSEIMMLDLYAQIYGYSLNSYIGSMYGKGVREKDIRRAMEMSALASKFAQQIEDGFYDVSTDEKVQKFFEENKNDYISADYLSYTFKVTLKDLKALAENKDKTDAEMKEIYAEKKNELIAKAEALAAFTTKEEFEAHVKELWLAENKENLHKKYYDEALKTAKGETEDEKKAAATKTADEKVEKEADDYVEGLLKENQYHPENKRTEDAVKYNKVTDEKLAEWIFGKGDVAAATVNSTKQITTDADKDVTDETKKTYSYTITVYFLTRAASKSEDTTRTFSYMMMTSDNFDETKAKAAFEQFKKGEITKEKLEELSKEDAYKSKAGFNTLEDFKEGVFGADEVDEWLYTDTRAKGDCELITYKIDKTTYYLIIVVDDIGPEEWYVDARDGMVADEVEEWFKAESKKHAVSFNQNAIDKIPM